MSERRESNIEGFGVKALSGPMIGFSTFDGMLFFLGFSLFLVAVVGQFSFLAVFKLETYKSAVGGVPLWDRIVAGAMGIIPLSFETYRAVSILLKSPSILPKISAATLTVAMVAYLFGLWLHDWNEDEKKHDKIRKWIRIILLLVIATPLVFLAFLLGHQL